MKKYLSIKRTLLSSFVMLLSFSTAFAIEVTVNFTSSTGDPIQGAQVDYRDNNSSFSVLGTTDENGQIVADVGAVTGNGVFKFYYDGVSKQKSQNIAADPIVNFKTVLTTFKVVDTDGNELLGTNARYKTGSTWKTFGSGNTTTTQELLPGTYAFRVTYNGNIKDLTYSIGNNSDVLFTIQLATVLLYDSEGNEIESDDIKIKENGLWVQFGDGKTPETIEMLPTSAQIRVYYNGAYQQINQNLGQNPNVIFNTVSVDYQSSGTIEYSFAGGALMPFNSPMELLPTNYNFKFSNSGYPNKEIFKTISNSEVKSLAYVRLLNSMGMPISGASIDFDLDGWTAGESTDADGVSFNLLEGSLTDLNTRVSYAGNSNELEQNIASNSYIDFSTVAVTMELLSSTGEELESSNAEYKINGNYYQFGDGITSESIELLRGSYKFKVYYAGAFIEKTKNVLDNANVQFNTVAVTLNLVASNGDEVSSANSIYSPFGSTTYFTFGSGMANETIELLPQNYKFRLFYGGAMQQKNSNVESNPIITFELIEVTVQLLDSNENELVSDNITYFITGNGWNQFSDGVTTATMDLLWGYYDFRVYYNGELLQQPQQIGSNPVVTFVYDNAPAIATEVNDELTLLSVEKSDETNNISATDNSSFVMKNIPVVVKNGGNYPNPFSISTVIEYEVITQTDLNISVYNIDGRLVKTLIRSEVHPGNYWIEFDGTDQNGNLLPGGTYIYRLSGVDFQETKRMIIQR